MIKAGWPCSVTAERVDIQALLGHESITTAQIDTQVGQERMERVGGKSTVIGR